MTLVHDEYNVHSIRQSRRSILRRYTVVAMDRSKFFCNPSTPIAYMFQYGVVIPFLIRILIRMRRTRTTLFVGIEIEIVSYVRISTDIVPYVRVVV